MAPTSRPCQSCYENTRQGGLKVTDKTVSTRSAVEDTHFLYGVTQIRNDAAEQRSAWICQLRNRWMRRQ